jgi:hypothetical protein
MEPWYKVATPRAEVREGRSFNPDEFAVALEQVVAGRGPDDYRKPEQFFARTYFTRALREHVGMVLRRLAGRTENCPAVMTLVTQFGGGKTHTLTALFHLAKHGNQVKSDPAIRQLLADAGLYEVPATKVAVFVGNAYDPSEGRETPWIDIARQLAGDAGVAALGPLAREVPPGTEALARLFELAGGSVLILCDEVLNYISRYRGTNAEKFFVFIDNLVRAMTATERCAAVISLPRSPVEMSEYDLEWQEKINKVVRRVAKDLISNDEAEISEVVRKRLFEDLGPEKIRKKVAKAYADWCFERRNQLPPEWTAVDTAATDAKAREFLRSRFEACYPFHPATISVFHRKWQGLPQFQQTRGALAMFAQWISYVYVEAHKRARNEVLITLGSAPLDSPSFRATVLGQLGENRLLHAIEADIAGPHSHARTLDVNTSGPLKDIHQRVATAILFESSGGQTDKSAHLPELRFALGEPGIETTSIDNAAAQLEARGFYIRRKGSDGFLFGPKPTLKKVVNDRRASLDEGEINEETRKIVREEFEKGKTLPLIIFPEDSSAIPDTTKLSLIVLDPDDEWNGNGKLQSKILEWTRNRGKSPRLYPAALIWCVRHPGLELRTRVEVLLAWRKVYREFFGGTLEGEFDPGDREEIKTKLQEAEQAARDEVWASYRHVVLYDGKAESGLNVLDLGAGHASSGESLTDRVLAALRSRALLNDSPGAGYLTRKWPEPFRKTGAWPLSALRQAFLNGTLERVLDPDKYLRERLPEFVKNGDFGLASGRQPEGRFLRVWFREALPADEIEFADDVYLLLPSTAEAYKKPTATVSTVEPTVVEPNVPPSTGAPTGETVAGSLFEESPGARPDAKMQKLRISGEIPPEIWQRLGHTLVPKLKASQNFRLGLDISVVVETAQAATLRREITQILEDLKLGGRVKIELMQGA